VLQGRQEQKRTVDKNAPIPFCPRDNKDASSAPIAAAAVKIIEQLREKKEEGRWGEGGTEAGSYEAMAMIMNFIFVPLLQLHHAQAAFSAGLFRWRRRRHLIQKKKEKRVGEKERTSGCRSVMSGRIFPSLNELSYYISLVIQSSAYCPRWAAAIGGRGHDSKKKKKETARFSLSGGGGHPLEDMPSLATNFWTATPRSSPNLRKKKGEKKKER